MSDETAVPKLNPQALKTERKDVDLGSEAESEGHDHVGREPGRMPAGDENALTHPTAGASPPAR